jgi:hypothetical protein
VRLLCLRAGVHACIRAASGEYPLYICPNTVRACAQECWSSHVPPSLCMLTRFSIFSQEFESSTRPAGACHFLPWPTKTHQVPIHVIFGRVAGGSAPGNLDVSVHKTPPWNSASVPACS